MDVSRRSFLRAALATGTVAVVPIELLVRAAAVSAASGAHYFTAHEYATCDAICSRILPSDASPGAAEARAVDFVDLFLAAFEVPATIADNPAIYLHGRFSGRNPYPNNQTGTPSTTFPPDQMQSNPPTGQRHFIGLNASEQLAWRLQLYGPSVITGDTSLPQAYRDAVAGNTIPVPAKGLRDLYRDGLAAFDSYAQQLGQADFATSPAPLQDGMLIMAGNPVFANVPVPLPVIGAPQAAKDLYPAVVINTFQGSFGLPEYGSKGGPSMWAWLGWDGDTQPLGNSIYDINLVDAQLGPNQGHNSGFGDPAVYVPRGGYREYREVSTNGGASPVPLTLADLLTFVPRH
ncbi:MAG TPA: gluconate 2-dehydrogenase subunit 3 family protein [Candidatus Dormibacteraeota bacterium]|jgi:hypothetical protein|nr:gluconate 2-dehydrogenase subunit 3 family protein [Candidatus Dormibacteraeota bacterium]